MEDLRQRAAGTVGAAGTQAVVLQQIITPVQQQLGQVYIPQTVRATANDLQTPRRGIRIRGRIHRIIRIRHRRRIRDRTHRMLHIRHRIRDRRLHGRNHRHYLHGRTHRRRLLHYRNHRNHLHGHMHHSSRRGCCQHRRMRQLQTLPHAKIHSLV